MIHLPMLTNILGQPASLQGVLSHHTGPGSTDLHACARALAACTGRILVTGMGASFFAAIPAVQALESKGHRVLHAEASDLLHFGQGSWRQDDVAIVISRSGGSVETLQLAEKLAAAGVFVIAVTNVPGSHLTSRANRTILISSASDQIVAVQTYTGTLLTLLLLAEQASCPNATTLASETSALLPTLAQFIEHTLTESDRWQEFFVGIDPLYLLGRGAALASLSEGALLFHETAKAATIAMSSGQFRHGPVEVVTATFRAILLGSPQATRHLDAQLAQDLRTMNAAVRWLGPQPVPVSVESLVTWPADISPALAPIFDIVPLQIAAYRTALWRNLHPGDFRYASEITENETGFPLLQASLA